MPFGVGNLLQFGGVGCGSNAILTGLHRRLETIKNGNRPAASFGILIHVENRSGQQAIRLTADLVRRAVVDGQVLRPAAGKICGDEKFAGTEQASAS